MLKFVLGSFEGDWALRNALFQTASLNADFIYRADLPDLPYFEPIARR